jgi:hypothetical protein
MAIEGIKVKIFKKNPFNGDNLYVNNFGTKRFTILYYYVNVYFLKIPIKMSS